MDIYVYRQKNRSIDCNPDNILCNPDNNFCNTYNIYFVTPTTNFVTPTTFLVTPTKKFCHLIILVKNKKNLSLFFAGFFVIASMYSKQTGVVFLLPIFGLLISAYFSGGRGSIKSNIVFMCFGALFCFLYLSICSMVFNDNFFYFII